MTGTMSADHLIIFCTCPDKDTAEKIARLLVESNKAACVSILPNMTSLYKWEGKIESAKEHLLMIKTHKDCYPSIETALRHHHPYDVPEVIAVPVEYGLPEYLHWINSCHSSKK